MHKKRVIEFETRATVPGFKTRATVARSPFLSLGGRGGSGFETRATVA